MKISWKAYENEIWLIKRYTVGGEERKPKGTLLVMNTGKVVKREGVFLLKSKIIKYTQHRKGHKFLVFLNTDGIKHVEIKELISKKYL